MMKLLNIKTHIWRRVVSHFVHKRGFPSLHNWFSINHEFGVGLLRFFFCILRNYLFFKPCDVTKLNKHRYHYEILWLMDLNKTFYIKNI